MNCRQPVVRPFLAGQLVERNEMVVAVDAGEHGGEETGTEVGLAAVVVQG